MGVVELKNRTVCTFNILLLRTYYEPNAIVSSQEPVPDQTGYSHDYHRRVGYNHKEIHADSL